MDVEISNNEAAGRYELAVDGAVASIAEYRVSDGRMVLPHTVTDPRYRGRGLAAQVVRRALDDARAADLLVVPACSFVADFIDEHPEYRDLVAP